MSGVVSDTAFDVTTLALGATLLLLSFLSLNYIFHLLFISRRARQLQHFNSLWTVRFFLVIFIILWSFNELLRIPLVRRHLPLHITRSHLCKIHTVLSFGLFEPAFLLTILYLVDVSVNDDRPRRPGSFTSFILGSCLPILFLQIFYHFVSGFETKLPEYFTRFSEVSLHSNQQGSVLCTYPLLGTTIFGAFAMVFLLSFSVSCGQVVSLVINKGLQLRIYALVMTIVMSLAVEILVLVWSVRWHPDKAAFDAAALVVFLCTYVRAAVGQGILVIKPILDSLAAGGENCSWQLCTIRPIEPIE